MSLPPNKNLLAEYKNPIYVETGVWRGDSLQQAINAKFETIHALDIDSKCLDFCSKRFDMTTVYRAHNDLRLYCGDSAEQLFYVLNYVNKPATIFLDSHWQMFEGTEPGENPFPLLDELAQIAAHSLRDRFTIIIDDMLIMQKDIVGYDRKDIMDTLLGINPKFEFKQIANPVINGILVAHPPK